jgi:hypothetical protein
MAAQAKIGCFRLEQTGGMNRFMYPVAVDTAQTHLRMMAAAEGGNFMILTVAGQALLAVFLACRAFESYNFALFAAVGSVFFARAMTGFAGILEPVFRAFLENGVRILVEGLDDFFVAGGAIFIVNAPGLGCRGRLLGRILGLEPVRAPGQNSRQNECCARQEEHFDYP